MFLGPAAALLASTAVAAPTKPQDLFATSLYNADGNNRTIINGLNLAGRGGAALFKTRDKNYANALIDTGRGRACALVTSNTGAETTSGATEDLVSFNSNGVSLGVGTFTNVNNPGDQDVLHAFARAPKFFDVVPYTGDGTSGRQIPHGLGVVPGMIIIKPRSAAGNWAVRHRSIAAGSGLLLDTTDAAFAAGIVAGTYDATSFQVSSGTQYNTSGTTYVAYLFAHDPAADGIIQCGSYTTDSSGTASPVVLGWRPQFGIFKNITAAGDWHLVDSMRGWATSTGGGTTASKVLYTNKPNSEENIGVPGLTSTGFRDEGSIAPSSTIVYCVIREAY